MRKFQQQRDAAFRPKMSWADVEVLLRRMRKVRLGEAKLVVAFRSMGSEETLILLMMDGEEKSRRRTQAGGHMDGELFQ